MTAPEVVKAAKAKGIKLSTQLVYAVRGKVKKPATRGPGRPPKSASGGGEIPFGPSGLVAEIERIVEARVNAILKARFSGLLG